MVDNQIIKKGKYKGKTFDELFQILKTDKKYINFIKKKEEYADFYEYYINRINNEENEITVLSNDNKIIKNCYHISDIHIRVSSRRYEEYKHIFEKLYTALREEEDGIIVITGDLLHSKCELSASCILLTLEFLTTLSSIFPTFLILGNHDLNLENLDETDSITAIIKERNIPNLYYLKDSGIYEYNNIVFGVSSLIDNKHIYAKDISSNKIKIALYHGRVAGCTNDVGYRLNQEKLLTDFDGYDFVMLGDIHTQQYLKPNVAYSSSLIMQNFSEIGEHGYLKWNLNNGNSSYINIINDYSHVSFEIHNNKISYNNNFYTPNEFYDICQLPPYGNFRLIPFDSDFSTIKEFKDVITKKTIKATFANRPNLNSKDKSIVNVFEKNDIKSLLIEYIKENNTTYDIDYIINIIDKIDIVDDKEVDATEWKIRMLKFDNMFSYGENNIINFDKIPNNEVIGINGNNSVGKSTLIDIISYILFDKTVRKTDNNDIINKTKNNFKAELTISVGKDIYVININAKKDKDNKLGKRHVKLSLNGVNLTGEQRLDTRKRLYDIIGDYNNFVFNSVCSQFGSIPFWEWTEGEQKKKLLQILNFNSLDKIKDSIKKSRKEIKEQNTCSKKILEKENNTEFEKDINVCTTTINQLESNLNNEKKKHIELQVSIDSKNKQLHFLPNENYEQINQKIIELRTQQTKLKQQNNDKIILQNKLKNLENQITNYNYNENEIMSDYNFINNKIENLSSKLTSVIQKKTSFNKEQLISQIKNLQIFEDKYKEICYFDDIIYEYQTSITNYQNQMKPTTINNINDINNLENYKNKLYKLRKELDNHMKIINDFSKEKYEKCITIKNQMDKLNNEINYCNELANKLINYEYNPECTFCLKNEFVQDAKKCENKIPNLIHEYNIIHEQYTNLVYILEDKEQYDISYNLSKTISNDINKLEQKINNIEIKINNIDLEKQISEIRNKVNTIMNDKKVIRDNYKLLLDCKNDIEYHNNIEIKNEIVLLKKSEEYIKYHDFITNKKKIIQIKEEINDINNRLIKYKDLDILITENSINLENLNKDIKCIEVNKNLEKEISQLETQKKDSFNKIQDYTKELSENKIKKEILNERLNQYNFEKKLQIELQKKEDLYEFLYSKLDKEGLKSHLLKYYLPQITSITNSIVNGFIDRTVDLVIENDKLEFRSYQKDTEHYTQMHGGMESFILDLALKIAISKLSYQPKCTMLFIDERLSVLDKEHLEDIDIILDFLKSTYEHTLIISHEQKLKDAINYQLAVKKHNVLSKIEF